MIYTPFCTMPKPFESIASIVKNETNVLGINQICLCFRKRQINSKLFWTRLNPTSKVKKMLEILQKNEAGISSMTQSQQQFTPQDPKNAKNPSV